MNGRIVKEGGPESQSSKQRGTRPFAKSLRRPFRPDRKGTTISLQHPKHRSISPSIRRVSRAEDHVYKSERGLDREGRRGSRDERRTRLDAGVPPQGARSLRQAARMPNRGGDLTGLDFDDIYDSSGRPKSRARPGTRFRSTLRTRSSELGIPQAERKFRPASAPSTNPRSSTTPCARDLEKLVRSSLTWTPRSCGSGSRQAVLRDYHSGQRQQVRRAELGGLVGWIIHLRAERRPDRSSALRPTSGSMPRTWASSSEP